MDDRLAEALAWLERRGSARTREEQLTRYGITAPKAFGVSIAMIQQLAARLGRDHALAAGLWKTGWYEARLLASFVDVPDEVTVAQMDRWARDFDNWGICDTVCFKLFDRTPHVWRRIEAWSSSRQEFVRRGAFALLACVALHDKQAPDERFIRALALAEAAATDERPFVTKGISWALRAIARRNPILRAATAQTAQRLADSENSAARSIGRLSLRELGAGKSPEKARTKSSTAKVPSSKPKRSANKTATRTALTPKRNRT